jgi:hypothetical protein
MITFNDLEFNQMPDSLHGGIQAHIKFDNGYGVSVVQHEWSYGNRDGLYESAVLGLDGDLCFTTPITDDVMDYLNEDDITNILKQIQEL